MTTVSTCELWAVNVGSRDAATVALAYYELRRHMRTVADVAPYFSAEGGAAFAAGRLGYPYRAWTDDELRAQIARLPGVAPFVLLVRRADPSIDADHDRRLQEIDRNTARDLAALDPTLPAPASDGVSTSTIILLTLVGVGVLGALWFYRVELGLLARKAAA